MESASEQTAGVLGGFRILAGHKEQSGGQGYIVPAVCEDDANPFVRKGTKVALKVMYAPEGGGEERVEREWRRVRRRTDELKKLDHPNVVRYYGCFRDTTEVLWQPKTVFVVVQELLEGMSLDRWLDEVQGGLDADDALAIVKYAADGLAAVSEIGIVHRDIKPSNIFICGDGAVKLIDFEIARLDRGGSTSSTESAERMRGTYRYMAPERLDAGFRADEQSDVFSLGVVFHELLRGHPPYKTAARDEAPDDEYKAYFQRWSRHDGKSPIAVSKRIATVLDGATEAIEKAVAPDRSQRFAGFAEFRAALDKVSHRRIKNPLGRCTYMLLKFVGEGGYGAVYKARKTPDGKAARGGADESTVALKVQYKHKDRLRREATSMISMRGEGFVEVDCGDACYFEQDGAAILAMKFLDGMPGATLRDAIRRAKRESRNDRLPAPAVFAAFRQYAFALERMHRKGLYHRDIKPSNLYFPEDDPAAAAVMDLGLVRDVANPTPLGSLVGTYDYLPPELAWNQAKSDARGDIYALGLCLYEALTGVPAFKPLPVKNKKGEKDPLVTFTAWTERARSLKRPELDAEPVSEIPELKRLIEEMTHPDPSHRIPNALEVAARLARIEQGFFGAGPADDAASGSSESEKPTPGAAGSGESGNVTDGFTPSTRGAPTRNGETPPPVSSASGTPATKMIRRKLPAKLQPYVPARPLRKRTSFLMRLARAAAAAALFCFGAGAAALAMQDGSVKVWMNKHFGWPELEKEHPSPTESTVEITNTVVKVETVIETNEVTVAKGDGVGMKTLFDTSFGSRASVSVRRTGLETFKDSIGALSNKEIKEEWEKRFNGEKQRFAADITNATDKAIEITGANGFSTNVPPRCEVRVRSEKGKCPTPWNAKLDDEHEPLLLSSNNNERIELKAENFRWRPVEVSLPELEKDIVLRIYSNGIEIACSTNTAIVELIPAETYKLEYKRSGREYGVDKWEGLKKTSRAGRSGFIDWKAPGDNEWKTTQEHDDRKKSLESFIRYLQAQLDSDEPYNTLLNRVANATNELQRKDKQLFRQEAKVKELEEKLREYTNNLVVVKVCNYTGDSKVSANKEVFREKKELWFAKKSDLEIEVARPGYESVRRKWSKGLANEWDILDQDFTAKNVTVVQPPDLPSNAVCSVVIGGKEETLEPCGKELKPGSYTIRCRRNGFEETSWTETVPPRPDGKYTMRFNGEWKREKKAAQGYLVSLPGGLEENNIQIFHGGKLMPGAVRMEGTQIFFYKKGVNDYTFTTNINITANITLPLPLQNYWHSTDELKSLKELEEVKKQDKADKQKPDNFYELIEYLDARKRTLEGYLKKWEKCENAKGIEINKFKEGLEKWIEGRKREKDVIEKLQVIANCQNSSEEAVTHFKNYYAIWKNNGKNHNGCKAVGEHIYQMAFKSKADIIEFTSRASDDTKGIVRKAIKELKIINETANEMKLEVKDIPEPVIDLD